MEGERSKRRIISISWQGGECCWWEQDCRSVPRVSSLPMGLVRVLNISTTRITNKRTNNQSIKINTKNHVTLPKCKFASTLHLLPNILPPSPPSPPSLPLPFELSKNIHRSALINTSMDIDQNVPKPPYPPSSTPPPVPNTNNHLESKSILVQNIHIQQNVTFPTPILQISMDIIINFTQIHLQLSQYNDIYIYIHI